MEIIYWTEIIVNAENPDIIQLNLLQKFGDFYRLNEKIIL